MLAFDPLSDQPLSSIADEIDGVSGSVNVILGNFTSSASGLVVTPGFVTGTANVALDDFTSSASGMAPVRGSANTTLGSFVSAASGVIRIPIEGSVNATLGDFVSSASGEVQLPVEGSINVVLGDFISTSRGIVGDVGPDFYFSVIGRIDPSDQVARGKIDSSFTNTQGSIVSTLNVIGRIRPNVQNEEGSI